MYKVICTASRVKRKNRVYEVWFYEEPNKHIIETYVRNVLPYASCDYTYDIFYMPDDV